MYLLTASLAGQSSSLVRQMAYARVVLLMVLKLAASELLGIHTPQRLLALQRCMQPRRAMLAPAYCHVSCNPVCNAVLDNLVKGAAGQALQNLNVMMGVPEETGLLQQAMFP